MIWTEWAGMEWWSMFNDIHERYTGQPCFWECSVTELEPYAYGND